MEKCARQYVYTEPLSTTHFNDNYIDELFKIEGKNKFIYCGGSLYIFDERSGMFSTDGGALIRYYLMKNKNFSSEFIV